MKKVLLLSILICSCIIVFCQPRVILFNITNVADSFQVEQTEVISGPVVTNTIFHTSNDDVLFYVAKEKTKWFVRAYDVKQRTSAIIGTSDFELTSIAMTPDQKGISALIKYPDGKSDLVRYPYPLAPPAVLASGVNFKQYAWVDDNSMIVLSPGNPNQLKLISLRPRKETPIAPNVGSTIQRFYSSPSVTFIHKQSFDFSTVKRVSAKDGRIEVVIDIPAEQEVFTWMPSETIISTDGEKLYSFKVKDSDWKSVNLKEVRLANISSLTVNASGTQLAMTISK